MKQYLKTNDIMLVIMATAILIINQSCTAQNNLLEFDNTNQTNSFFDNSEVIKLPIGELKVAGEVFQTGIANMSDLPLREIIVKETLTENGEDKFVGAYRYIGYSLADILNPFVAKKINAAEFPPQTDMYVEIENDKGEKVVVSWGEIYYSNGLNDIIIATAVARIVPEKSKEMWVLPTESKLIVGNDLLTYRNISNPIKITVKSYSNSNIEIIKGKDPLYSDKIEIFANDKIVSTITDKFDFSKTETVHNIFYGKGRGLHSTKPFTGIDLKDVLLEFAGILPQNLQTALIVVVADDGYQTVYTWSEISNRNDQSTILLMCNPELKDDGIFRVYPSCDFFSDRSVKGVDRIFIIK